MALPNKNASTDKQTGKAVKNSNSGSKFITKPGGKPAAFSKMPVRTGGGRGR